MAVSDSTCAIRAHYLSKGCGSRSALSAVDLDVKRGTKRGAVVQQQASSPLDTTVAATRSIDAASVLPVALGVPTTLVMGLGLTIGKRRRLA